MVRVMEHRELTSTDLYEMAAEVDKVPSGPDKIYAWGILQQAWEIDRALMNDLFQYMDRMIRSKPEPR